MFFDPDHFQQYADDHHVLRKPSLKYFLS